MSCLLCDPTDLIFREHVFGQLPSRSIGEEKLVSGRAFGTFNSTASKIDESSEYGIDHACSSTVVPVPFHPFDGVSDGGVIWNLVQEEELGSSCEQSALHFWIDLVPISIEYVIYQCRER